MFYSQFSDWTLFLITLLGFGFPLKKLVEVERRLSDLPKAITSTA
jgi:hypothetical protein